MYLFIKQDQVTHTLPFPMTVLFHFAKWTNTQLSINFNCTAQAQNFLSLQLRPKATDHPQRCTNFGPFNMTFYLKRQNLTKQHKNYFLIH